VGLVDHGERHYTLAVKFDGRKLFNLNGNIHQPSLDCGAASELNRIFFMFSAPLCGGENARVEVQNVGNILRESP
jgi:hypothetical protein